MPITYVNGDATNPQGGGNKVIAHICNDIAAWGSGFVLAVSKKWPEPEARYKSVKGTPDMALGKVQLVSVASPTSDQLWVANMIAQRNIKKVKEGTLDECPPIRYPALYDCLDAVGAFAKTNNASLHCPRFGADRAGGDWRVIEAVIQATIIAKYGLDITIYDWTPPAVAQPVAGQNADPLA